MKVGAVSSIQHAWACWEPRASNHEVEKAALFKLSSKRRTFNLPSNQFDQVVQKNDTELKCRRMLKSAAACIMLAAVTLCSSSNHVYARQECNCEGCPCCVPEDGGLPLLAHRHNHSKPGQTTRHCHCSCQGDAYCEPDASGVENVCLVTDGVQSCHVCGYLPGEPCCIAKITGSPFCSDANTACATYAEPDERGAQGECECDEISYPDAETGLCIKDCACDGCDCCEGPSGKGFCKENPLGDTLVCADPDWKFLPDGVKCNTCGYSSGQPCCGQDLEGVEPFCNADNLECLDVWGENEWICYCTDGEQCDDGDPIDSGNGNNGPPGAYGDDANMGSY